MAGSKTGQLTLGDLADMVNAVKRKMHRTFVRMGHELRELEAFKRKHGICTRGMSCLKLAVGKGSRKGVTLWCEDHAPGTPAKMHREPTPYGLAMLAERAQERSERRRARSSEKKRAA